MGATLLGGPGFDPATLDEKKDFRKLCKRIPDVTDEELRRMQRIEWCLTLAEYNILKFGE